VELGPSGIRSTSWLRPDRHGRDGVLPPHVREMIAGHNAVAAHRPPGDVAGAVLFCCVDWSVSSRRYLRGRRLADGLRRLPWLDVEIEIVEQRGRCPNGTSVGERFLAGRLTPAGLAWGV